MGVNCKERKGRFRWRVQRYGGLEVWALEASQKGRAGEECERDGRPAWMVRWAGGRSSSALNATVKNLDFSPAGKMGLEGGRPGQNQTGAFSVVIPTDPSLPDQVCSVNSCGTNE